MFTLKFNLKNWKLKIEGQILFYTYINNTEGLLSKRKRTYKQRFIAVYRTNISWLTMRFHSVHDVAFFIRHDPPEFADDFVPILPSRCPGHRDVTWRHTWFPRDISPVCTVRRHIGHTGHSSSDTVAPSQQSSSYIRRAEHSHPLYHTL